MILGFISLLLTIGTRVVATICIPAGLGSTMLPCKRDYNKKGDAGYGGGDRRRKLFSYAEDVVFHRVLAAAAAGGGETCSKPVSHLTGQCSHHHDFYCVDSVFNFFLNKN